MQAKFLLYICLLLIISTCTNIKTQEDNDPYIPATQIFPAVKLATAHVNEKAASLIASESDLIRITEFTYLFSDQTNTVFLKGDSDDWIISSHPERDPNLEFSEMKSTLIPDSNNDELEEPFKAFIYFTYLLNGVIHSEESVLDIPVRE